MKVEDMVTVQGSLAKDGSKLVNARNVVLAAVLSGPAGSVSSEALACHWIFIRVL